MDVKCRRLAKFNPPPNLTDLLSLIMLYETVASEEKATVISKLQINIFQVFLVEGVFYKG